MSRRHRDNKKSPGALILVVIFIACVYMIMALFDSSLTGEGGRELGKYLRNSWGGAVIVLLLFGIYLSGATLMKRRVPRVRRQIFGTIQLYISFAFMLGLLHEVGWKSELTLAQPGSLGAGLAKFFVLNVGTFITLLLVLLSFMLAAYLFGLKILSVELPSLASLKFKLRRKRKNKNYRNREGNFENETDEDNEKIHRPRRKREQSEYKPSFPAPKLANTGELTQEEIDFMKNIPAPILRDDYEDYYHDTEENGEVNIIPACSNTIEIIDNILAALDSGELDAPAKRRANNLPRTKKLRRPLPDLTAPDAKEIEAAEKPINTKAAFPPIELFGPSANNKIDKPDSDVKEFKPSIEETQGEIIIATLKNFDVNATLANIVKGPSVIQYQLELSSGTKVSQLEALDNEITLALATKAVRIEAPILGTHYAGIEIPNSERKIITLGSLLDDEAFKASRSRLPLALGVQIDNKILVQGLDDMPHLLIAGKKGSGRSMFVNSCILSMCSVRTPEELNLILIDPRHVEFAPYDGLPHLLTAPIFETSKAIKALKWAFDEMEQRTSEFARTHVKNLAAYNRKLPKKDRLPEIVIIIDELADLIFSGENEIESLLGKLSQKAGPAGINLILAVQKPSAEIVTTMIKANISARAAFTLSNKDEAKNFGVPDAVKLTGKGDFLFTSASFPQPIRLQAPFINEEKISDFVEYVSASFAKNEYAKF